MPMTNGAALNDAILSSAVVRELREQHERLVSGPDAGGNTLNADVNARMLDNFTRKFGPERLATLQGSALLQEMHGRGSNDSLVYWLEFKNDGDFATRRFGSISGGSAFKFGIFQRASDARWTTGSGAKPEVIDEATAIEIATAQRDSLVKGARLVAELGESPQPEDYIQLQERLNECDAELFSYAWTHKYLSLNFPTILDDYHNPDYQRFHLVEMGVCPLDGPDDGASRYVNAGLYRAIAHEVGITLFELSQLLNEKFSRPHSWFLCNFDRLHLSQADLAAMMSEGVLSLGFGEVGDLSGIGYSTREREMVRGWASSDSTVLWRFRHMMNPNDIVAVWVGGKPVALAKITGHYEYFSSGGTTKHRRAATWRHWPADFTIDAPLPTFLLTKLVTTKWAPAAVGVQLGWQLGELPEVGDRPEGAPPALEPLTGVRLRIEETLKRRHQVILYGPPGTGKTYWGLGTTKELAARRIFGKSWAALTAGERARTWGHDDAHVQLTTFHPSYGYEDFIEGYRPVEVDGHLSYELTDGIFKRLCRRAEANPDLPYYLVIDEINRGDVPRIFGELITLIESDKRGEDWPARLPLSRERFSVPKNLYLIGTMNTADRSITVLDSALRRRFGFVELLPDYAPLEGAEVLGRGLSIAGFLKALNGRIADQLGADGRNLQVGHAYFMTDARPITDSDDFAAVVAEEVFPLVQEYCYGRPEQLERVFGPALLKEDTGQMHASLSTQDAVDHFYDALLQDFSELADTALVREAEIDEIDDSDEPATDGDGAT